MSQTRYAGWLAERRRCAGISFTVPLVAKIGGVAQGCLVILLLNDGHESILVSAFRWT